MCKSEQCLRYRQPADGESGREPLMLTIMQLYPTFSHGDTYESDCSVKLRVKQH